MATRIAFLDKNLENYHSNIFLKSIREDLKDQKIELVGVYGLEEEAGRAWATKNNVPYFDDLAKLNPLVDGYLVIAPSSPDQHLSLAEKVFPFGKPVYIDKTFAPNLKTAQAIFATADKHKVPVQSYSVLRDTNLQDTVATLPDPVLHMLVWAPAGKIMEYLVHPLEMVMSIFGPKVTRVMRRGTDTTVQLLLDFTEGRTAVINLHPGQQVPYAAVVSTAKETRSIEVQTEPMWAKTIQRTVDFIVAKKPNVDRNETLAIMKVIDLFNDPAVLKGFVTI